MGNTLAWICSWTAQDRVFARIFTKVPRKCPIIRESVGTLSAEELGTMSKNSLRGIILRVRRVGQGDRFYYHSSSLDHRPIE